MTTTLVFLFPLLYPGLCKPVVVSRFRALVNGFPYRNFALSMGCDYRSSEIAFFFLYDDCLSRMPL